MYFTWVLLQWSPLEMVSFNFFNYIENPIANFCAKQNKNLEVYSLEDMMPYIQKLPNSKACLLQDKKVSIGNQLRLYLSTLHDNFTYIDLDVFLGSEAISEIKKYENCIYYNKSINKIEPGTFFHSNKNCKFIKFYLDKYSDITSNILSPNIFAKYPYDLDLINLMSGDMHLIKPNIRHFYISNFYRFKNCNPNIGIIKYTFNDRIVTEEPTFWQLNNGLDDIKSSFNGISNTYYFNTIVNGLSRDTVFNLWKEQLNYVYGKEMQFEEI